MISVRPNPHTHHRRYILRSASPDAMVEDRCTLLRGCMTTADECNGSAQQPKKGSSSAGGESKWPRSGFPPPGRGPNRNICCSVGHAVSKIQSSSHPCSGKLWCSGWLCPSRRLTHPTKPLNLMYPGEGSMAVPPALVMGLPQGAECVPLSRQKSVLVENHNSCMEPRGWRLNVPEGLAGAARRTDAAMAPSLSYAWMVWISLVASGEASPGDRSWLYTDCLDV